MPGALSGLGIVVAILLIIFAVVLVVIAVAWLNRPRLVIVNESPPADFPAEGFCHGLFQQLLEEYVDRDGNVDYARWHETRDDVRRLESYLAAVALFSPNESPDRFENQSDQLAYWLYAYNAYVIKSILDRWPIGSVTDVRAPLEIVKGFGFFYQRRFLFGGERYSLYAVENDIIRDTYRDPRIHFVLNCGSGGCPAMQPKLPTGDKLESLLQQAAEQFVSDMDNVSIDHDSRTVRLSAIFKWYKSDFVNALRRQALSTENGLMAYLATVAPADMAADVSQAQDYKITFADYDWSVNALQALAD